MTYLADFNIDYKLIEFS